MKIGLRTVKTAVAATLSMLLANWLQLLYAPAAGIIAVLSVGNTKKTSLKTALGRIISLMIATGLAFVCFNVLGFHPLAFGIYLLLFIPISATLKLTDGIVVNSVLMTHFLIEQSFAPALILNEFLLMLIGVGFALLFNLYMPDLQKHLQEDQLVIDVQFKRLLEKMAQNINRPQQHDLLAVCNNLLDYIREAQKKAEIHSANQWVGENDYFEEYFTMRRAQLRLLNDLIALLDTIAVEDDFVMAIRELIQETAATFGEANDGQALLQRILAVYESYRLSPLPQSREEFENRARLFQFLQTFTNFIEIKAEFANEKKLEIG